MYHFPGRRSISSCTLKAFPCACLPCIIHLRFRCIHFSSINVHIASSLVRGCECTNVNEPLEMTPLASGASRASRASAESKTESSKVGGVKSRGCNQGKHLGTSGETIKSMTSTFLRICLSESAYHSFSKQATQPFNYYTMYSTP